MQSEFNDAINDRDVEPLEYHDENREFDSDVAWKTFNAPDDEELDIKLQTVTEM
jgi:hypothetical protein